MRSFFFLVSSIITGSLLVLLLFGISLFSIGEREQGQLENIQGIPYPVKDDKIVITEALAHFDLYLKEPVLFKAVRISFDFIPHRSRTLSVGIRENSFWLSYQPHVFYTATDTITPTDQPRRAEIFLPVTNKIQDADRSLDVMLIANNIHEQTTVDHTNDPVVWEISNIQTETVHHFAQWIDIKDYLKSIFYRERPL